MALQTSEPAPARTGDDPVRIVHDHAERIFTWSYERERQQLVGLYNKANALQWNSVTDLDWDTQVDLDLAVDHDSPLLRVARAAAEVPGSPIASWGEAEFATLARESFAASLSQFMHGEQGAMMTAAKLVETVPWIDAKYYAATQTMDEARHTEVFARYLDSKVGTVYPMGPYLAAQIFGLLEDSRWDIAYLGMQIIIESLALAAFGDMRRRTTEPLLSELLRLVMADEARHVAFGVISLSEYYKQMSAAELLERQEFIADNTLNSRSRATTPEVWERMGVSLDALLPYFHEAIAATGANPLSTFQRGFFSKLVPNVRKLGLLDVNDGWLRRKWGEAGLLQWEFADAGDPDAAPDPLGTGVPVS